MQQPWHCKCPFQTKLQAASEPSDILSRVGGHLGLAATPLLTHRARRRSLLRGILGRLCGSGGCERCLSCEHAARPGAKDLLAFRNPTLRWLACAASTNSRRCVARPLRGSLACGKKGEKKGMKHKDNRKRKAKRDASRRRLRHFVWGPGSIRGRGLSGPKLCSQGSQGSLGSSWAPWAPRTRPLEGGDLGDATRLRGQFLAYAHFF